MQKTSINIYLYFNSIHKKMKWFDKISHDVKSGKTDSETSPMETIDAMHLYIYEHT